jgi:type I restriction enzyme S subunit
MSPKRNTDIPVSGSKRKRRLKHPRSLEGNSRDDQGMSVAATESAIDGWKTTPLKAEVTLKNGKAYNAKSWKTEGYPIIRIQNLKDPSASFNYFQGDPETQLPIRKGDLVFSWSGSKGTSFGPHVWHGELGVLNQHIFKVILNPDSQLDQDFLFFALKFLTEQIEDKAYGLAALVHVRKGDLEATPIPVPPLPEQKKIAHILSTVQRAIAAQERIIQTTTELKKTLMHKLFTEGLRREPQKQTEIGPVPESWEVVPLSECAIVQTGIAKGRKVDPEEAIELPYLRVANVQDGYLDLAEMKTITIRKKERERYGLQDGDVVLTEGGDFDKLGRGFIWHGQIEECVHQNHVFAVRPDTNRISSEFFAYQSQSPYGKAYFLSVAHKTTNLACINTTKLKAFPVLLPSKEQQMDIVNACQGIDGKIASARAKRDHIKDLFRTLLHELMTAKTRVNMIPSETIAR